VLKVGERVVLEPGVRGNVARPHVVRKRRGVQAGYRLSSELKAMFAASNAND
jgi:hypothetical protein